MDFRINIATPNGTGSYTANRLLTKILLKNGIFCSSKNLFPSNIAGLPTWFNIRINKEKFTGFKKETNIYIGFNKKTYLSDLEDIGSDALVITNKDFKLSTSNKETIEIPIRELTKPLSESPSLRKLLSNLVYVGYCAKILGCNKEKSIEVLKKDFLKKSEELFKLNTDAFLKGFDYQNETESEATFFKQEKAPQTLTTDFDETHLIDGNTASALGFLDGGASVVTWYPITPSSSLVENFEKIGRTLKSSKGITVLQCEDEISSAVAVLGAGWSGARAFTATSGPGLSLMQESIGLGYFSEVPMVIADVQRAGPSTGLPTRTAQGDLLTAHYSSHGDTLHPVLLPSSVQELYDDSFQSLNLAESLQTPIILLSDLDLGMNDWSTKALQRSNKVNRGQVVTSKQDDFKRYKLNKNLPERSLPRISDPSLSYFTRGSGHDEKGRYSENPEVYESKLTKLKNKVIKNKNLFPKDILKEENSEFSLIFYGSTTQIIKEVNALLGESISTYQIRSLPCDQKVYDFAKKYKFNFVLEQNRDGQMHKILKANSLNENFVSLTQFNGLPSTAEHFVFQIKTYLEKDS